MFIYLLVTENKEMRWALENVDSNQSGIYPRKQRCHYTSPDSHVMHHCHGMEVRGKPCGECYTKIQQKNILVAKKMIPEI